MRNKLLKTGAVLFLTTLLFTQCKKSLLSYDPTIPLSSVDNYYSNEAEAVIAVNAAYTPLSAIYNGAAWHIGDIMSDDADLGGGGGGDGLVHQLVVGRVTCATHLVFVQLPQFKNGPAHLRWASTLVNQCLVNDLADLRGIKLLFHPSNSGCFNSVCSE